MANNLYKGDEAYCRLASAIIEAAIFDYKQELGRYGKLIYSQSPRIKELNRFFSGQWFEALGCLASRNTMEIDGESLLKAIERNLERK